MPSQMSSQQTHVESQPATADRVDLAMLEQDCDKTRALKQAAMQDSSPGGRG
jgi:hypothetical protein